MALSVRIFGLSSWSILLPQALLGVASAAVLYASVRRALSGRLSEPWHVTPTRAHVAGLVAFAAMVVSFGPYIAIVELVPASWRPYIGGSQNNSLLELTFGYNGLGRLSGNETGSVGGAAASTSQWGSTGLLRMFTSESGEMVSFLIPGALILAGIAFAVIGRKAYANALRRGETTGETLAVGALGLYGSWLVINGLVFSFMAGIYHDYYTVALAPVIAGGLISPTAYSIQTALTAHTGSIVTARPASSGLAGNSSGRGSMGGAPGQGGTRTGTIPQGGAPGGTTGT